MKRGHGGDIYSRYDIKYSDKITDFSANINPFGMPHEIRKAIIDHVDDYSVYPDPLCRDLTSLMAEKKGLREENIVFGNGAADIIYRIAVALKPKKALLLAPTFSEYEDALKVVDCEVRYFTLLRENGFKITDEYTDMIDSGTDMIFICNPNNPTGVLTNKDLLGKILKKASENSVTVVIDECFMDFVNDEPQSMLGEIQNYPNLIILGAFTKMYAMAGLRLGYMFCGSEKIVEKIKNAAQPWSVSTVASVAALAALEMEWYEEKTREYVASQRAYLTKELRKLGYEPFESHANYILFYSPDVSIKAKLEEYGILIRSCDNYHGLDGHYFRIAVKLEEENMDLIRCLKKIGGTENG